MAALFRLPLLHPPVWKEPAKKAGVPQDPLHVEPEGPKPKFRHECLPGGFNEKRPCAWFSCQYHLTGEKASCTLDVAEEGEHTLEEVAEIIGGISRERVRQIEEVALHKLKKKGVNLRQYLKD